MLKLPVISNAPTADKLGVQADPRNQPVELCKAFLEVFLIIRSVAVPLIKSRIPDINRRAKAVGIFKYLYGKCPTVSIYIMGFALFDKCLPNAHSNRQTFRSGQIAAKLQAGCGRNLELRNSVNNSLVIRIQSHEPRAHIVFSVCLSGHGLSCQET